MRVRAGDSLETVAALRLGELNEVHDMNTGWKWLAARNVAVESDYIHFRFGFCHNRLAMVSLAVSRERTMLAGSWENWSEHTEKNRLVEFKHWVHAEVGREGRFSWGTVTASYDEKSASSGITITYE
ncbi:MAG TPA: hypothetical protein VF690_05335 [Hymenobacter sp.]